MEGWRKGGGREAGHEGTDWVGLGGKHFGSEAIPRPFVHSTMTDGDSVSWLYCLEHPGLTHNFKPTLPPIVSKPNSPNLFPAKSENTKITLHHLGRSYRCFKLFPTTFELFPPIWPPLLVFLMFPPHQLGPNIQS